MTFDPVVMFPQGLFLQRQAAVSEEFADFVTTQLITTRKLWKELCTGSCRL